MNVLLIFLIAIATRNTGESILVGDIPWNIKLLRCDDPACRLGDDPICVRKFSAQREESLIRGCFVKKQLACQKDAHFRVVKNGCKQFTDAGIRGMSAQNTNKVSRLYLHKTPASLKNKQNIRKGMTKQLEITQLENREQVTESVKYHGKHNGKLKVDVISHHTENKHKHEEQTSATENITKNSKLREDLRPNTVHTARATGRISARTAAAASKLLRNTDDKTRHRTTMKPATSKQRTKTKYATTRQRSTTKPTKTRQQTTTKPSITRQRTTTKPSTTRQRTTTKPATSRRRRKTKPAITRQQSTTKPATTRQRSRTKPATRITATTSLTTTSFQTHLAASKLLRNTDDTTRQRTTTKPATTRQRTKTKPSTTRQRTKTKPATTRQPTKTKPSTTRQRTTTKPATSRRRRKTKPATTRQRTTTKPATTRQRTTTKPATARQRVATKPATSITTTTTLCSGEGAFCHHNYDSSDYD